ncbi:MAG: efflux RND transporter periplasmic adaptor subunit [Bacteroidota bacterium]|nr:efflux RND transporter periplasmic adaptor subunit [Bacteroidota bacterium]
MKKKILIIVTAIAAIIALLLIIGSGTNHGQVRAAKAAAAPIAVEVRPASAATITETVSSVGTISAMKDVMVSSETQGRVTNIYVKAGDRVRTGQILVQVDDELKKIAVEQAEAQLLAAGTNYNKAEKDLERAEKLFKTGDVADVEVEGDRLAARSAEAQYKSAQVALKYAERQFNDTKIKSRISGYVASKKIEVGEIVAPGREIANIVDISNLKVKLSIPEEDIVKIQPKQLCTLRVDAAPGYEFNGVVYSVGEKSESLTGHSYPVEIIVENKNTSILKVGMFARVAIHTKYVADAVTISKESLVSDESNPQVFVVENNVAHLRNVKLGVRSGNVYQVTDGVRKGDLVVSFGQKELKDGAPVQYKNEE